MEWFRGGLREAGYVEGQNLSLDVRHAEKADRLSELANQLVHSNVSVIVSFGAKALGLTILPSLLLRADQVIE